MAWATGLAANRNEGVAGLIKQTAYSIGYVELTYALQNDITVGRVRNSSGAFVKADLASVNAAAAVAREACRIIFAFPSPTHPEPRPNRSPLSRGCSSRNRPIAPHREKPW